MRNRLPFVSMIYVFELFEYKWKRGNL